MLDTESSEDVPGAQGLLTTHTLLDTPSHGMSHSVPACHRPMSGLTVSIAVVGMGDTSEPLLTSCVPDLWQQALVILPNLSLVSPAPHSCNLTCSFTFMPSTSRTLF